MLRLLKLHKRNHVRVKGHSFLTVCRARALNSTLHAWAMLYAKTTQCLESESKTIVDKSLSILYATWQKWETPLFSLKKKGIVGVLYQ